MQEALIEAARGVKLSDEKRPLRERLVWVNSSLSVLYHLGGCLRPIADVKDQSIWVASTQHFVR